MAEVRCSPDQFNLEIILTELDYERLNQIITIQKTSMLQTLEVVIEIGIVRLLKSLTQKESGVLSVEYKPPT